MLEELHEFIEKHKMEKLFNTAQALEVWPKVCHINLMTQIALQLAKDDESIDSELLTICCLHHDDGYAIQYQIWGSFDNRSDYHHALGLDLLDAYLMNHKISITPEIQILRACIYYHNRISLADLSLDENTKKYVQLVSTANQIEKKCLAPVYNIAHKMSNYQVIGIYPRSSRYNKKIRPALLEAFSNGQEFYELVDFHGCDTPAEDVLHEINSVMRYIKEYGDIAKWAIQNISCYGFTSALTGYSHLLRIYLSLADAEFAISLLEKALK